MKKAVVLPALLALCFLTSCTPRHALSILGTVWRTVAGSFQSGSATVSLLSDPALDTMSALINGRPLNYPDYRGRYGESFSYYLVDTVIPVAGVTQKLEVKTDVGNASSEVMMPEDFPLTLTPADSVPLNAALEVGWSAAVGAGWYMVTARLDTGMSEYKDTICFAGPGDSRFTVPAGWLDHDGRVTVQVAAGCGPKIKAGAEGNIDDAQGYWVATNSRTGQAKVGGGLLNSTPPLLMTGEEVARAWLETVASSDPVAAEILSGTRR